MEEKQAITEIDQPLKVEELKNSPPYLEENYAIGSYLESWFSCLKLSKEYTQNCRTGIFPSATAYDTYRLFGSVEFLSFNEWWQKWGLKNFGDSFVDFPER